eukprot:4571433-Prymnesium_polylepis.2
MCTRSPLPLAVPPASLARRRTDRPPPRAPGALSVCASARCIAPSCVWQTARRYRVHRVIHVDARLDGDVPQPGG